MASRDGWYLVGPLVAVALVAILAAFLRWSFERDATIRGADPLSDLYAEGLAIFGGRFGEREDYGLLSPAALTDDPDLAQDIRRLLADAGIRSTFAVRPSGRVIVLVFAEEVEEARRLVGGFPAL